MANVNIKYECGCGERFYDVQLALFHAATVGHTLTIHGSVTPTNQEELNAKIYRAVKK